MARSDLTPEHERAYRTAVREALETGYQILNDGGSSLEGEPQEFKVPHLRNAYQKVGMFGMPDQDPVVGGITNLPGDNDHMGNQIRSFGFFHDGSFDSLFRFFRISAFAFPSDPADPPGPATSESSHAAAIVCVTSSGSLTGARSTKKTPSLKRSST